jgi:8-oxo-dGTP pyrophosphatase MutT (NUDIX family)
MHPLYRHITHNNTVSWADYLPLNLAGKNLGCVHHAVATSLCDAKLLIQKSDALFLVDEQHDTDRRSKQLRTILHHLIEKKFIAKERFELYPVSISFKDEPVALADRALISSLGFVAYGVHCNGYVKKNSGLYLWVGKRSSDRAVDPGKYDHMIAGGQPHGLTVRENLAKEAHEEAGLPAHIIERAKSVGCITYNRGMPNGIRRDGLFLFDLKCPDDFIPHNQDGEVESFHLMPAAEVLNLIHTTDQFKFNVNLVLIDFFIRHGIIRSDEPGYAELCAGLHTPYQRD